MTQLVDAIVHIESVPDLTAWLEANAPDRVDSESGEITGFDVTPSVRNGDAALLYLRMPIAQRGFFIVAPNVHVLAETAYTGNGYEARDILFAEVFADEDKRTTYRTFVPGIPDPESSGELIDLPFGMIA